MSVPAITLTAILFLCFSCPTDINALTRKIHHKNGSTESIEVYVSYTNNPWGPSAVLETGGGGSKEQYRWECTVVRRTWRLRRRRSPSSAPDVFVLCVCTPVGNSSFDSFYRFQHERRTSPRKLPFFCFCSAPFATVVINSTLQLPVRRYPCSGPWRGKPRPEGNTLRASPFN